MNQQLRATSRLWLLFAAFLFAQGVWAQAISLTGPSSYTQNFDALSNTAGSTTNNLTIPGWFLTESGGGARDNEQYAVDTGGSTTGDMYSYGAAASTDRALGQLRSGTLIPIFGAAFTNNTGSTITSLAISYTGEEWRLGTAARADRLDFQYSTNATDLVTGTYFDVDALDFSTPNQTTAGAKDGNVTGNRTLISWTITGLSIAPGATFWIRFNDIDATGADDGLAIDDFSITPQAVPPVNLAINDVSLNEGNAGTTTYTFTVNLSAPAPAGGVTFDIATADGTATAPGDYTARSLTGQTIPAGSSTYAFTVLGNGDTTPETNETFFVNVSNVTGAGAAVTDGQGQGTIVNDDAAPTLTINDVSLNEGNAGTTTYTFTVNLSAPAPAGGVTFDIATANSTAIAPGDYTAKSLTSQTIPAGSSTYTFDVLVNGDITPETDETFFVNVTNATNAIITDGQGQGTIVNDEFSQIHDVQGNGATTPVPGATLTIEGIVTRTFSGSTALNGFYLQEEDADADADPNTSEGVFIYDPSGYFTGTSGSKVRVTGTVSEFTSSAKGNTSSLTQITLSSAANVVTVSTGNPLPTAVNVTLPVTAVSDLEKYEGMLVTMSAASGNLTVTEYFELGRFGQVVLSATGATDQPGTDARLDQYTQFFAPSVAGYSAYLAEIAKRRIYLDDGRTGANPDPIIFGRGGQPLSASNTLRGGDQVTSITAILDERSEGYRLQTNTGVDFQPANPRPATPPVVGGTLKVGNFNLLNYFNDLGTSNFTTCSGNAIGRRGANNATEFTRQRDKIINAIINSGSDVLGLNEMENNGFGSNSAIQDLVNGLNAVAGANSFTYINSGCISTDAITVAMIYKPAKATPVGASAAIPFNYGTGSFTDVGRRSLAQTFQQTSNGAVFTLVSNHWKSKGSGTLGAGDADINDGQSQFNGTRTRQAQDVASWLATNPTGTTDPDYLIVGDLNAYAKEDPLTTLESGGYTNLVPNTTYSYVFDGFVGALDHALRSSSLAGQVAGADKWHINSDEPSVLDYNTEFKTAGQITSLYSPEPYRASDHDPVLIGLNLTAPVVVTPLALTFTASPTMLTTSGTTTLSATVSGGTTPYSYTFTGSSGTITPSGNTATVSNLMAGVQTFTVVARDATTPTSQTISGTVSVTVSAANTPPVATANANQTATVGVAFSYTVNAFTDAESPNSLTYSASISPMNGFSFDPATRIISGTPSMSGVTSVTITATDPGSLSASTTFTITVSPAPVVVTPLALTFTASPTMLTTSGTITLSATVSGGTTPYNYVFSGSSGNITPSGNTATVSNLMAGVQTYTVVVSDATSPTSQTISGTVSVTVSAANTPPVATANANQTATVGVAFSYTVNAFTDNETPNQLTYQASINPANGLSFDPATRVISGTPSMSGVSSVTVTATDPGSLSASTTFTITVSPAPVVGNAQLTVLHQDVSFGQTTTNTILPYLQLVNAGSAPIAYSAITVRYWLTVEGNSPITNFQNYYVQIGGNNVHEQYVPLATPRQGATAYVEYRFDAAAGNLVGGTNSGPIQNGFSKADYSAFNQSDDYSYVANRDYTANARITAYVNGVLVYGQEPPGMGSVTPLALTLTANPTMLTTSGTTTLSATVSGGTTPYSYTFTGPGTITPSGNTASVSNLMAGVQTYTVVARDATSPTSQTISGTVSVTVTQANTAPVATANANQTATVGVAFSYTVNAFTDNETPNQLTYQASINPANGLSFDPATRVISGTPSMTGVSSVTVTATDPGSLSASTTFTITVSPAPVVGNAQLTVLHQDVSFGQTTTNTILPYLQLVNSGSAPIAYSAITVRYWLTVEGNSPITNFQNYYVQIGGNNVHEQYVPLATPRQGATAYVEYRFDAAAGNLVGGTNSGPIQNGFSKGDYSAFNQSDDYSYVANRDYTANARITAYVNGVLVYGQEPPVGVRVGAIGTEVPLGVQVLGNPVHEMLNVEVTGASGSSLHLTLTDGQGRIVGQQAIEQASTSERVHFKVGQQPSGVLMLRATTPTQSQTVKVLKTE